MLLSAGNSPLLRSVYARRYERQNFGDDATVESNKRCGKYLGERGRWEMGWDGRSMNETLLQQQRIVSRC